MYDRGVKTSLALAAIAFSAGSAWAADVPFATNVDGVKTQMSSGTWQRVSTAGQTGTFEIPSGVTVKTHGNENSLCNYVGIDSSGTTTLNINGTLICSKNVANVTSGGYLCIGGNDKGSTGIVNVKTGGTLTVDKILRLGTWWNSYNGSPAHGTLNVDGGTVNVGGSIFVGGDASNTGSSTINLKGGTLTATEIVFKKHNGQAFNFSGGTLKAPQANVFRPYAFVGGNNKSRTITVTASTTSTFDTQGKTPQCILPMTGTGVLNFTGGGTLTFLQQTLTYGLKFSGTSAFNVPPGLQMRTLEFATGAKINIDVLSSNRSGVLITTTDGITLPADTSIADFVKVGNGTVTLSQDGKSVVVTDNAAAPYAAFWTGNGTADDVTDPANWTCKNFAGTVIADAIPGSGTTVCLTGTAAKPMPSSAVSALGVRYFFGDIFAHTKPTWYRIGYGYNRGDTYNFAYLQTALTSYTYKGSGDGKLMENLNGKNTSWQGSNLKQSQLRYDGWFNVPSDEAGTWTFYQSFDDYYGLAIDDVWVIANQSYQVSAQATAQVSAGWHRFTIIAGDTWGGFGSQYDSDKYPLEVTTPKKTKQQFSSSGGFTIATDAFPSAKLSSDLDLRGKTAIVRPQASIDLNGNRLDINSNFSGINMGWSSLTDSSSAKTATLGVSNASGTVTLPNTSGMITVEKTGNGTLSATQANGLGIDTIYLSAGTLAAGGICSALVQSDGTLQVGGGGITTNAYTCTQRTPQIRLNAGTLQATADFVTKSYAHAVFGEQPLTPAQASNLAYYYTFNRNGKTITWKCPITGFANVKVADTGTGTFTSDASYQGAVFGNWTVDATGVDLSGVSSFGGNLALFPKATATVNIAGESQIEAAHWFGTTAFDTAVAYALNPTNGMGYVVSNLKQLHAFVSPGDPNQCAWAYRGEFYVPEEKAGRWYFAGTYDDKVGLYIDNTLVLTNTGWQAVGTGSRTLSAGWHPFVVACYDGTGGQGPSLEAWKTKAMALGWSLSNGGTEANNYTKFDPSTLQMRLPQQHACGAQLNGTLVRTLAKLHTTDRDLATTNQSTYAGLFYVSADRAGSWKFRAQCTGGLVLKIDGAAVLTAAEEAAEGALSLAAGWHAYTIGWTTDAAGLSGAGLTDGDGKASSLVAQAPGSAKELCFDESNFRFAANVFEAQGVNRNGICGMLTLNPGSTLTSGASYCPIWGTLNGSGTLSGKFRFVGEDNCWEIKCDANNVVTKVTFANADANTLSGLKKLKIHFTAAPVLPKYELMAAGLGLTSTNVDKLKFEVTGPNGMNLTRRYFLSVNDGTLNLRYRTTLCVIVK